jgi:hypothetical protein
MNWNTFIEQNYEHACNTKTDIDEHLPVLRALGEVCDHITEMGVRFGASSKAFLCCDATLISYDIEYNEQVNKLFEIAKDNGKSVEYIIEDVLKTEIVPTDLLFIDTWHSNEQLRQELALHGDQAQQFLVFHDTQTYGLQDESWNKIKPSEPGCGLLPAIIDFVIENPHWQFHTHRTNCNGLTVLERR